MKNRRVSIDPVDNKTLAVDSVDSPWETMLVDVRKELQDARKKVCHLEQSEKIIQEKIQFHEPFPCEHQPTNI